MAEHDLSQADVYKALNISATTFSAWVNGLYYPRVDKIELLANFFGVNKSDLIEDTSSSKAGYIPLYGSIPAGPENWTSDDVQSWVPFEPKTSGQYFSLTIHGTSMQPVLMDGDVVYVRSQPNVASGEIAIVSIGGYEGTCKEVRYTDKGLLLVGYNTDVYTPQFYTAEEVASLPVMIRGKVVGLQRRFE